MSAQPSIIPTPEVTEADRAWAREQVAKAPMPEDLVHYINGLRRDAAREAAHGSPDLAARSAGVRGRVAAGGERPTPLRRSSRTAAEATSRTGRSAS